MICLCWVFADIMGYLVNKVLWATMFLGMSVIMSWLTVCRHERPKLQMRGFFLQRAYCWHPCSSVLRWCRQITFSFWCAKSKSSSWGRKKSPCPSPWRIVTQVATGGTRHLERWKTFMCKFPLIGFPVSHLLWSKTSWHAQMRRGSRVLDPRSDEKDILPHFLVPAVVDAWWCDVWLCVCTDVALFSKSATAWEWNDKCASYSRLKQAFCWHTKESLL